MRLPDPIANTTTEAYLAYKAGVLKEADLQPKLKHPTNHFDAWLAYWTGLTTDYPKNEKGEPECLFDEEALVAFLAGVTNTYPEEIKDPYDVRIVGYLKYLVSARFKQPEETFNNEELYLSMMKTATASNDTPGSDITINDTLKAPFDSMSIYGNTEQVKTSGYNVFKFLKSNNAPHQGVATEIDSNGYILVKGTALVGWSLVTDYNNNNIILPGTYTLSINNPLPINISSHGDIITNEKYILLGKIPSGKTEVTFNVLEPIKNFRLTIDTTQNDKVNTKFRPMLEVGSEAHPYEPYTGGFSNLFDEFFGLPKTVDGITATSQNGGLKMTGLPIRDWVNIQQQVITPLLIDGGTYTLVNYNVTDKGYLELSRQKKDGSWGHINSRNKKTLTFTVDFGTYSMYKVHINMGSVASYNGQSITIYNNYALFQGDYNENNLPEYSPYNTGLTSPRPQFPQPINGVNDMTFYIQGKNLFDTRFGNRTIHGVSVKTYNDGSFELNGTPTNGFSLTNVFGSKSYVPAGSYKIKVEILGGSVQKVEPSATFLCVYTIQLSSTGSNSEYVREADITAGNIKEFTNTVNNPKSDMYTPYIWIPYHIENKKAFYSYNNLRMRATLVPNGENTDFVEFENNSLSASLPTLHKVGNYQDRIYVKDNKWYLEKNTATKILNGSENWIKTAELENIFICQNIINATKNYDDAYFSHFSNIKRYPNTDKTGAIRGDNGTNVAFCMNNIQDITGFKNWLNQNNVTVLYPIAQPTTTEITDQAIISRLNAIKESGSYEGITRIVATGNGDNPPALVKFSALKFR